MLIVFRVYNIMVFFVIYGGMVSLSKLGDWCCWPMMFIGVEVFGVCKETIAYRRWFFLGRKMIGS
jgi:hypothetical protein